MVAGVAVASSEIEKLLAPAPTGGPGGPDPQYQPAFIELERAAAGKAERGIGGPVIAAEPPDRRKVVASARALLTESKDLRVALHLTRALLDLNGFVGMLEGLRVARGIVERYWDSFHPQIERDGAEEDATKRINALRALTHRDMVLAVRAAPLVVSRVLGPVSLKAFDVAMSRPVAPVGKGADADKGAAAGPTVANLEAAFHSVSHEATAEALANVVGCVAEVNALAAGWEQKLPGQGPDFTDIRRVLGQAEQKLQGAMNGRQVGQPAASVAAEGQQASPTIMPAAPAASPAATPVALSGEIRSREDAIRALDAICAYYARSEPSSPLPLFLQRCKRMVTMSFTDILKELLPDAVASLQKIAGKIDA
jgi:type VI secretion system protein ImpA